MKNKQDSIRIVHGKQGSKEDKIEPTQEKYIKWVLGLDRDTPGT